MWYQWHPLPGCHILYILRRCRKAHGAVGFYLFFPTAPFYLMSKPGHCPQCGAKGEKKEHWLSTVPGEYSKVMLRYRCPEVSCVKVDDVNKFKKTRTTWIEEAQ